MPSKRQLRATCACVTVVPVLETIYPNYGVVAGGTRVTINGSYEQRITPVAVRFAQFQSTIIVISTPPSV